jgi:hypothetical protein
VRKGVPGLLGDLEAQKAGMGGFGGESGDPRPGSPA